MEFCPTAVWPVIPVWVMETMVVDMKLLEMKARMEGVDLVSEFNSYEEAKYRDYVQLYTDGSKDPETGSTGAAVAVPSHRWGICRRTPKGGQTRHCYAVTQFQCYAVSDQARRIADKTYCMK